MRGRRRRGWLLAFLPLVLLVLVEGTVALASRHPLGASTPGDAAYGLVAALTDKDRAAVDELVGPDVADRSRMVDTLLNRFGGRLVDPDLEVLDTASTGVKRVTVTGRLDDSAYAGTFWVARTRDRWFVVTWG